MCPRLDPHVSMHRGGDCDDLDAGSRILYRVSSRGACAYLTPHFLTGIELFLAFPKLDTYITVLDTENSPRVKLH
jgi:hypothetical protein